LQKSKYFQANRHFLISMLNPEHLTNFKNLKTKHTNKTLNKTEFINKKTANIEQYRTPDSQLRGSEGGFI